MTFLRVICRLTRCVAGCLAFLGQVQPIGASDFVVGATEAVVVEDPQAGGSRLCADDVDNVYLLAMTSDYQLTVTRSSNRGRDWGSPVVIEDLPGFPNPGGAALACDDLGHVYVAWADQSFGFQDLLFTASADFGATWMAEPIRLNSSPPGTTFSQFPRIALDALGHVYVVWQDCCGTSDPTGIHLNSSADFGSTWLTSDIHVDALVLGLGMYPEIAADDQGHVYVLFQEEVGEASSNYYLATSDDFGNSIASEVRVNPLDIPPAASARVTADPDGQVVVMWVDRRNSPTGCCLELFCNSSFDYGRTFQATDVRVNAFPLGNVGVACHHLGQGGPGVYYALWVDARDGYGRVFFNKSIDYGLTWESVDTAASPLRTETMANCKLTSTRSGHLYAAYAYFGGSIYFTGSCDDGATWADDLRMNADGGLIAIASLASDNRGNAYVSWAYLFPTQSRCNWASASVGVGIENISESAMLPPEGGTIDYAVSLRNSTTSPIGPLCAWVDVTKPNRTTYPPIVGPKTISLRPPKVKLRTLRLRVPGRLPSGQYILSLKVSGSITDQARLIFIKE